MQESATTRMPPTGHTLVEMVAALAIVSILALGVGSAMLVASRAVDPDNRPRATHAAAQAAARLIRELEFATAFTERTTHAVTFTVADRDGDAAEETIRYAWSGETGDPLTRALNGGTAVALLDDVRQCDLAYDLKSLTEQPDPTRNESAEQPLAAHEVAGEARNFAVQNDRWVGQYFDPSLTAGALSWRVTRVLVKARIHGADKGVAGVQLRLPDGSNHPTDIVLEEVPMYEDRLTDGYLWQEFTFSHAGGLPPSRGLCLVVACIRDDADLCDVQYDGEGEEGGGNAGGLLRTYDGGASWTRDAGACLLFSIHGTVTTTSEPEPVTRTWVRGVRLRLRAGPDASTAVESGVRVLNAPEVLSE